MTDEQKAELKELEDEINISNIKRFESKIKSLESEIEGMKMAKLEVKKINESEFLDGMNKLYTAISFDDNGYFLGFNASSNSPKFRFEINNNHLKLDLYNKMSFKIENLELEIKELSRYTDAEKIKFGMEMSPK